MRQLNVYFERDGRRASRNAGAPSTNIIGDAIMAAWGDIAAASLGPEKDAQERRALGLDDAARSCATLNVEREAAGSRSPAHRHRTEPWRGVWSA